MAPASKDYVQVQGENQYFYIPRVSALPTLRTSTNLNLPFLAKESSVIVGKRMDHH